METVTITKEQWDDSGGLSWSTICEIGTVHETEEDYDGWRLENLKGHIKDQPETKDPKPSQETDYKYMGSEELLNLFMRIDFNSTKKSVYEKIKQLEAELEHRLQSYKVPEKSLTEVELLDMYLQLEQDVNGSPIDKANLRLKILDKMGAMDETDEQIYYRGLVKGY